MKRFIINTTNGVIETTRESKVAIRAGFYIIKKEYKKSGELTNGKIMVNLSCIVTVEEVAFAEQENG